MSAYERIIACLNDAGISGARMMRDLGYSSGLLYQWKRGEHSISSEKIKAIAAYLNVSPSYLLTGEHPNAELLHDNIYQIPIFESVSAGFGAYADDHIVGYMPFIVHQCDASSVIAVKVSGDSMYPLIDDGDTIIIRKQDFVESGSIAVVMLDDDALVKKIVYDSDSVTLHSVNPEYKPRVFRGDDVERLRIVGRVTDIIKHI